MSSGVNHHIKKLVVELGIPEQNGAIKLQNQVVEAFQSKLFGVIDELFSQYDIPGYTIEIDFLELNLGVINHNKLKEEIERQLVKVLQKKLIEIQEAIKVPVLRAALKTAINVQPEQKVSHDSFVYFLNYGLFPWFGHQNVSESTFLEIKEKSFSSNSSFIERLRSIAKNTPQDLYHIIQSSTNPERIIKRLSYHLSFQSFQELIIQTNPKPELIKLIRHVDRFVKQDIHKKVFLQIVLHHLMFNRNADLLKSAKLFLSVRELQKLLDQILEFSFEDEKKPLIEKSKKDTSDGVSEFKMLLESLKQKSLKKAGLKTIQKAVYQELNQQLKTLASVIKDNELFSKSGIGNVFHDLTLQLKLLISEISDNNLISGVTGKSIFKELIRQLKLLVAIIGENSQIPESEIQGIFKELAEQLKLLTAAIGDNNTGTRSGVRRIFEDLASQLKRASSFTNETLIVDQGVKNALWQLIKQLQLLVFIVQEKKEVLKVLKDKESEIEIIKSKNKGKPDKAIQEEGIYITNAGLVIVWPYIMTLFKRLGLAENKEFKGEEEQQRAILLLHYLSTGKTDAEEIELALNKVLCNWPIEDPVPLSILLTTEEKQECDDLLNAIISHWKALGKASIEALQETFLIREGILHYKDEKRWILRVERKGVDILVDKLDWSIAMVRPGWNKYTIYVEW